jgi:hypothetical protein
MATIFTILAEIDFNAPTAIGIPLGVLLLLWFFYQMNTQSGAGGGYSSANTMDVDLRNEVAADVVLFEHSEANMSGGRCTINYRVKLKQAGTYVIAGGKAVSGSFDSSYCGTRTVTGDAGDVISGAVSCSQFNSGIWGIGAFRSSNDVPKV